MNLTPSQVSNLCLLADFMEGLQLGPTDRFSMAMYWIGSHECGSPSCALGWACMVPALKKAGLSPQGLGFSTFAIDTPKRAREFFGDVYLELFAQRLTHTIKTPQQWAAHCRAFLKENGYEVAKSDGFDKFMKKVREPVQFCPVNSNGEWV